MRRLEVETRRNRGRALAAVFLFGIGRRETLDIEARERFLLALERLDGEIGDRASFKDDPEMAICDLRVAEWAVYALPGDALVERVRLFRRFQEHFGAEPGKFGNLERFLGPWNERVG